MEAKHYAQVTPRLRDPAMALVPAMDFSSTYVQRKLASMPKQGTVAPWKAYQNYALDLLMLRFGSVQDDVLEFSNPPAPVKAAAPQRAAVQETAAMPR